MTPEDRLQRRAAAAADFDQHERRSDGTRVAAALSDGLNLLRDLFFTRVHVDVEQRFGMDSLLSPVSMMKSENNAKAEIDIYQIVESTLDARDRRYVSTSDDWYLEWLTGLRLGDALAKPAVTQRMAHYTAKAPDQRRRAFSSVLERTLPEARHAPLIVYQLLPLAVSAITAIAFGQLAQAAEARKRQVAFLPSIVDCHECRGGLLEIGERCQQCGNPFWKYDWLTAE